MIFPQSIRARLAVWYTALTLAAMAVTGAMVWLLVQHSVRQAADDRLAAHSVGLERFVNGLEKDLSLSDLRDEYREYADVSLGTSLLQMTNAAGETLAMPDAAGWGAAVSAMRRGDKRPRDVTIGGEPYRMESFTPSLPGGELHAIVAVPLGASYLALNEARTVMLWLLPLVCALAAAGTYLISGRALQPLDRLATAAQAIDVGNLSHRLEVPSPEGELQRLAVTFNGMLDRLESGVANIARFTSEASHELRTPVARVRTTSELALRRERSADDYRRALADIQAESERMSDLVEDLLTMARSDAGVEAAPEEIVDLGEAAAAFVEGIRPSLGDRAADVVLASAPTGALIHAETRQIRRLLAILCENAVKYTPAGRRVFVRVERDDARARLIVEDEGNGVSADDRPRVFERFFRGAAARAGSAGGSGLGLSIADVIARRLGGTISLESPAGPAAALGTRVTVSLPIAL
jgi:two-component system heavy metal sensor histidine kinase CusS